MREWRVTLKKEKKHPTIVGLKAGHPSPCKDGDRSFFESRDSVQMVMGLAKTERAFVHPAKKRERIAIKGRYKKHKSRGGEKWRAKKEKIDKDGGAGKKRLPPGGKGARKEKSNKLRGKTGRKTRSKADL